jgi:hypothetical protein
VLRPTVSPQVNWLTSIAAEVRLQSSGVATLWSTWALSS